MQDNHAVAINKTRVMLGLIAIYIIFAILLNSVGTVILQVISNFSVSKSAASVLEGFKDIPIAVVSFLVASYLPRFGYKNAMLVGLGIVTLTALAMPLVPSFMMTKMLFLSVGISFALVKVSVYSMLGLICDSVKAHASNMNILEGCFMLGVLAGYWLFGAFIEANPADPNSWLQVYWLIAALASATFVLILTTPMPSSKAMAKPVKAKADFLAMLKLATLPFVLTFVLSAFFYVLIEQGIGSWLPTFNNEVLQLPADISVQITSIFAACLAIGRLSAGVILRRINWYPLLLGCIACMAILLVVVLPLIVPKNTAQISGGWLSIPIAAFVLPVIGMFMAPIYPAINSAVLSILPHAKQASMTGLIVIFSALGGTLGSIITGSIFEYYSGQVAFYFMLVPMLILTITLTLFKRLLDKQTA
jgi:FHS family glucose/mannose:H+ symporter-like MFS transporter